MGTALAQTALLLSGFAGLVYQVCWIRQAQLVFGGTTQATSAVLAVFFLGLAVGSELSGRYASRSVRPLRAFAAVEVALAALAAASPATFAAAEAVYGHAYRALGPEAGLLLVARAAVVACVVAPPAALMGASLPLFAQRFVRREARIGAGVGALYGVNTLGAALGCLATGFVLLPSLGVAGSVRLAACLNLLAAATAAWLARRAPGLEPSAAPVAAAASGESRIVGALFFVTGFVALAGEVLWTRFLGLVVRNTIHTYTLTLAAALFGIVLGAGLAALLADRVRDRAFVFGALQAATGLTLLALMGLPPPLWRTLEADLALAPLLLLPAMVLSGACFPLAVRMAVSDPARAGAGVGRMTAVNTLGGIAGALAAGFLGLPVVGLHGSLLALTGLAVAAGAVAWLRLSRASAPRRAAAVALALAPWLGLAATGARLPHAFLGERGALVEVREGVGANLAVVRGQGGVHLEIDRWWQGARARTHQAFAAHVPMWLHRRPERVLVVGAGTGQTASRFLRYPEVEALHVAELEPEVFPLILAHFGGAWLDDPRTLALAADGREHLLHTDVRYDVIAVEAGQLTRPGVAWLYTAEFYRAARARLGPGGVLSQFLPLPFLPPDELRAAVATFLDAFPEALLWYNTSELLLLGVHQGDARLLPERIARLAARPEIAADLRWAHWGGEEQWWTHREAFLAAFLLGPRELAAFASGAAPRHDDPPRLEYAVSGVPPTATYEIAAAAGLRRHLAPPQALGVPLSPAEAERIARLREGNLAEIEASARVRIAEQARGRLGEDALRALLEEAQGLCPGHPGAAAMLADLDIRAGDFAAAERRLREILAGRPGDPSAMRGLAHALLRQGDARPAAYYYRELLEMDPDDAETHNDLGVALAVSGDLRRARSHFERALALRPDYPDAARNLARAERP